MQPKFEEVHTCAQLRKNTASYFSVPYSAGGTVTRVIYLFARSEQELVPGKTCTMLSIEEADIQRRVLDPPEYTKVIPTAGLPSDCSFEDFFKVYREFYELDYLPLKFWSKKVYSIDCEKIELLQKGEWVARVSVVDSTLSVILSTYIRPDEGDLIADLKTPVSGVHQEDVDAAFFTREEAVKRVLDAMECESLFSFFYRPDGTRYTLGEIQEILERTGVMLPIVIGHGLTNDLKVLCLLNLPYVIDTQHLFGELLL